MARSSSEAFVHDLVDVATAAAETRAEALRARMPEVRTQDRQH
jgi:hypothetical protein